MLKDAQQKPALRHVYISDITAAVESFIDGYVQNDPTGIKAVHIAVSINNDVVDGDAAMNAEHARAWADMVQAIQAYAYSYPQIFVSAGIDAEPGFDPGPPPGYGDLDISATENWMQGYSETGISLVFDFGSLDGYPCRPSTYPDPGFPPLEPCSGWNVDRDYKVAWGIEQARPVPEIYQPLFARARFQNTIFVRDGLTGSVRGNAI